MLKNYLFTLAAFLTVFFFTSCCLMTQTTDFFSVVYSAEDSNGGSIPKDTAIYSDGASVTIASADSLVRTGYTFLNWNTASDGKGTSYTPGDKTKINGKDLYMYAQWKAESVSQLEIGSIGPAGGIIVYDKGSITEGWRYLEAAPAATEGSAVAWNYYAEVTGASGFEIGTGKANTDIITASPAAKACIDLVYGGYDDWFLPSQAELDTMSTALAASEDALTITAYWSSTEIIFEMDWNSYEAWALTPGSGSMNTDKKTACRVRAVRTF